MCTLYGRSSSTGWWVFGKPFVEFIVKFLDYSTGPSRRPLFLPLWLRSSPWLLHHPSTRQLLYRHGECYQFCSSYLGLCHVAWNGEGMKMWCTIYGAKTLGDKDGVCSNGRQDSVSYPERDVYCGLCRQISWFCPFSVCLSLYSLNSTIFQLISYLYLSWNGYFSDQLCELFFPGMGRCLVEVTKNGASAALVFWSSLHIRQCYRGDYSLRSSVARLFRADSFQRSMCVFHASILFHKGGGHSQSEARVFSEGRLQPVCFRSRFTLPKRFSGLACWWRCVAWRCSHKLCCFFERQETCTQWSSSTWPSITWH